MMIMMAWYEDEHIETYSRDERPTFLQGSQHHPRLIITKACHLLLH
jgi:hypothetical protein